MDAAEFEAAIRRELDLRDQRLRARLFHPGTFTEATELCVQGILGAAGIPDTTDQGKKLRRVRRARAADEAEAFGEGAP